MAIRLSHLVMAIKWRKVAKRTAAAFLLLVGGGAILIHLSPVQQFLLRRAENFGRVFGFPFTARRVQLRPFALEMSLDGFSYDHLGVKVEIDRVTLDVPWNVYTSKGIAVKTFEADGVRIKIASPEPLVPEPSGETTAVPRLDVEHLVIRNASLSYANQSTRLDIPAFSLEAHNKRGTLKLGAPLTVSPDTVLRIPEIPFVLSSDSLQIERTKWAAQYGPRKGSGSAIGTLRWAPTIAASLTFDTEPLAIETWDNVVAQGKVLYEDGVLNVTNFRAHRGNGEVTGSAKITDQDKSAKILWNAVSLDPLGVRGTTGGELDLQWKASDFTDASGTGRITVTTPEYGRVDSNVRLDQGRANLDLRAAAMGANIHANINTGMDQKLAGTFLVTHKQYGLITAQGKLRGTLTAPLVDARVAANHVTYQGVGPLDATAHATYRDQVISLTQLAAQLKNSSISSGKIQVNLKTRALEGSVPEIHAQLGDFVADGKGQIEGAASIAGSIEHPVATLAASSPELFVGGTRIESAEAEAGLRDGTLHVTKLVARQKDGILDATGTVNLETEQTQAQVHVSNLQITEVRGLSATVNLDAEVSGSYKAPSATLKGDLENVVYGGEDRGKIAIDGTADTHTLNLKLQSEKYNATVDGVVELKAPYPYTATATTNASQVQYQQYKAVANGKVKAEGTVTPMALSTLQLEGFTLVGEGIDLKADGALDTGIKVDVAANLAQLPVQNVQLTGQAQIAATVHGPLNDPKIDGDLKTTDATIRTVQMPDAATVSTSVNFTEDRFTIREMHADYAEAKVVIEGSGTIKGTGEFSFKAENIRPERIMPDRQLAGVVGLEGQLKVKAPRLDSIEGQAKVTQLELNAHDVEIHQVQPGEISFENQVLSVRNFELQGPGTQASLSGTADFGTGKLNFDLRANTDLRILEGFIPNSAAFGRIESEVAVRGTTKQPDMRGFVVLNDAEIQMAEPPLVLSGVSARIELSGSQLQIAQATGDLNGGSFTISGGASLSSAGLGNTSVKVDLMKTQLEYPQGLQSEVTANLALNGSSPNLELTGNVTILEALYREDINLEETVFEQLTPPEAMAFVRREKPGIANAINLDVTVDTMAPVTITNNVADLDLMGNFRVRGTIGEPVVLGRAEALDGGEVYVGLKKGGEAAAVGERRDRYIIQRGTVEFNNTLRTEPSLDIEAVHDLNVKGENYLVTLRATGTPTDLRTEMTSDPPLDEKDIQAMLITGRSYQELQQQSALVGFARESAIDYLSGKLTSNVLQNAGAALGLDTVTLEPATLAADNDVSARITVGKDITQALGLVYSQNLSGSPDQTWIVNYSTFKNFVVRGINRPDRDEVRLELRHGLEFGGGPALPRRVAPRDEVKLNDVTFTGSAFPEEQLRKQITKQGKPYSITRMNDDVRSIRQFLADQQFVDARVRARRTVAGGVADVKFFIEDGPKVAFEYRGAPVSKSAQQEIIQIWMDGIAEAASLKESTAFLLREFRDHGYLQAKVSVKNESTDPNSRHFAFQIDRGVRIAQPHWVFQGTEPLPNVTQSAGTIMEQPEAVRDQIEYELRAVGYLDATSTVPELRIDPRNGPQFVVSVTKGPQYVVSAIHYAGNSHFKDEDLTHAVILGPTMAIPADQIGATRPPAAVEQLKPFPYTSNWVSVARRRIMTEYWQQGFNDVQVGASTQYVPGSGRIEVSLDIKEGTRQEIAGILIFGNDKTALDHVRRYFRFSQGDPVDYGRMNLTRKKLYDTGLFKRVDIKVPDEAQGYVARVDLNERAPWSFKYGIAVTDHQSHSTLGLSTEITRRNLFGKGILGGTSLKADRDIREGRVFAAFPVFMGRDVATTSSVFRTRQYFDDIVSNVWGFTLQQQWRLSDYYLLSYDYTYRRLSTFERDLAEDDPDILDGVLRVARFNITLTRDTRNDILNATRGTFLSNSFDLAPPGIGSAVHYVRNYAQYLRFREVIKKGWIYASAYRLGLARAFDGGNLVPSDQFRAGGSTSLRAFGTDKSALEPGKALIVTNQELRVPLFWRFGAVAFLDVGNVYNSVGTARVFEQRYSPGFGFRLDKFLLFRVDVGMNLWPRTGEDRQTLSFGIGQAF